MKKQYTFPLVCLLLLLFGSAELTAQNTNCDPGTVTPTKVRFQSRDFFGSFVKYSNLRYWHVDNWLTADEEYHMDIYTPPNSDPYNTSGTPRPLVIWAHPGGFVTGDKATDSGVLWCEELAKMGYVCANINYRQDMVGDITAAIAAFMGSGGGAERAVYKGMQDGRTAIRYLQYHRNTYNIDINNIYFAGSSAGGLMSLHVAYLEEAERPVDTYGNWALSDLGCIDCGEGEVNSYGNGDTEAVIAMWGGLGAPDVIDNASGTQQDDEPVLLLHGIEDETVVAGVGPPFQTNFFTAWLGSWTLPDIYGTIPLRQRLDGLNNGPDWEAHLLCHEDHTFWLNHFEPNSGNGDFGDAGIPDENYDYIFNNSVDFFYDYISTSGAMTMPQTAEIDTYEEQTTPITDLAVCDNVAKGTTGQNAFNVYWVPQNAGSTYCWDVTKGTVIADYDNEIWVRWDNTVDIALGRTGTVMCREINSGTVYKESEMLVTIIDDNLTIAPVASFTAATSLVGALTYSFINTSTNDSHATMAWTWDFGDGNTSTAENPTHTYAAPGSYTVTLTCMNHCGARSIFTMALTVLPVELLSFTATPEKNSVELDWVTVSETNNAYFDVEKSVDGSRFEAIGKVAGAGTTAEKQNYQFTDNVPVEGMNYYRLKQVDTNGDFDYSDIRTVTFGKEGGSIQVHPNPAVEVTTVSFNGIEGEATIEVFDVLGQKVMTQNVPNGENAVTIDIQKLTSGTYLVQLSNNIQQLTQKLIVE